MLLRGLERRRLVKARWIKAGKVRERRQYQITTLGRRELQERKRELIQAVAPEVLRAGIAKFKERIARLLEQSQSAAGASP